VLGEQLERLVVSHVVVVPCGDGVDLGDLVEHVDVHDGRGGAARRVGAAQSGDPRRPAGEHPLQRLHLAGVAAPVGVGAPLIALGVGARVHGAQVEVVAPPQVVGEPLCLGEQVAGVQEHDVGGGDGLADQVDEHGVAEPGGHDEPVAELLAGPPEHLARVGVLEHSMSKPKPE
jgi:hypothetical protein